MFGYQTTGRRLYCCLDMQCLIFKHIFSDAGLQSQRTARQSDQEAGKAANEGVPVVRGDVALLGNLLNQCFQ